MVRGQAFARRSSAAGGSSRERAFGEGLAGGRGMRGQAFSADFVFGCVIFGVVLMLLIPIWTALTSQTREAEVRKDLQIATVAVADLFMRSPGSPANWSAANVLSIGLANTAHELNTTKFLRLRELDYADAKQTLGLGAYNFTLNLSERNGFVATSGIAHSPVAYYSASAHEIFPLLSESGLVWDYYWGHDMPAGDPPHGDARNFYGASEATAFNSMLYSAAFNNSYRTIIVEQPGLASSSANLTLLRQFVQDGGILIFEGQGSGGEILIDGMGATAHNGAPASGIVLARDWFLQEDAGSAVSFTDSAWSFYSPGASPITIEVADTSNHSRGLIANWEYGSGRIYYITDINGSSGGSDLSALIPIAGEKLSYGMPFTNESFDVFVAKRSAVLATDDGGGRRMVSMELQVWR